MAEVGELQIFDALPPPIEDALRASIERFGVLVPVVRDQRGRTVDGHHRSRIADKLGVAYRVDVVQVADDAEAREVARTLNADRRQLTEEQRRQVVLVLAAETVAAGKGGREEVARHSPEAIAGALGVSAPTVRSDIAQLESAFELTRPAKTLGLDNKVRPTKRPTASRAPKPVGRRSRRPLPDLAKEGGWALRKHVEKLEKIFTDDRFAENREKVAIHLNGHLKYAVETLRGLLDRIDHTEGV